MIQFKLFCSLIFDLIEFTIYSKDYNLNIFLRSLIGSVSCSTLLVASTTYDKLLPESINTGGDIKVTADCKYAPGNANSKEDCHVGMYDLGGLQNFTYSGDGNLTITTQLPTGKTNKDIILELATFTTDGKGQLELKEFHGVSVSSLNFQNGSSVTVNLKDQIGNSTYGNQGVFVIRDNFYNRQSQLIQSTLKINNGNMIIGKTSFLISEHSTLEVSGNSGNNNGNGMQSGKLSNQGHITNYGTIVAKSIKNGETVTVGVGPPPGITNQDVSGVIDNYGVIKGDIDNAAKGTINIHAFNGSLGKIDGQLDNKGTINIFIVGAKYGEHTIANANSTDVNKANIIYQNSSNDFIEAKMNGNDKINIIKKETKIVTFRQSLSSQGISLLDALDSHYNIYTYGGSDFIKNVINDTQKGVYSTYVSAPFTMLESMKPNFNPYSKNLDLQLIGNAFFGQNIGIGGLGGLNGAYTQNTNNHTLQYQLGYGYGFIVQNRTNYDADIKGHLMSLGAIDRISLGEKLELDFSLYSLVGIFNSLQNLKIASTNQSSSVSKTNFNMLHFGLDSLAGYKIQSRGFTLKPFAGLNQLFSMRNKALEDGGLGAKIPSTNAYMLHLALGSETQYKFANQYLMYSRFGYEYRIFNTQQNLNVGLNGVNLLLYTPFIHSLSFNIGGEIPIGKNSILNISGFYKGAPIESIHYLGGNISYRHNF